MNALRILVLYAVMAAAIVVVGFWQSWNLSLSIVNLGLLSAIMALGVNIQWGYAGLFNVGIMGFSALGGLAAVLISQPPVAEAWAAGGVGMAISFLLLLIAIALIVLVRRLLHGFLRGALTVIIVIGSYFVIRIFYVPAVDAIEAYHPSETGFLGGADLPIILSWVVGGVFAAGAAWVVGKVSLGLRSDYLAIATLGISEIIVETLKNEEWLDRGVKNVTGLPRPVPFEINLQHEQWFIQLTATFRLGPVDRLEHLRQAVLRGPVPCRAGHRDVAVGEARSTRPGAA